MQDLITLVIIGAGVATLLRLIRIRTACLIILAGLLLPTLSPWLLPFAGGKLGHLFTLLMPFKQLFLILLGLGVVIGLVSPGNAVRKTLRVLFMPVVLFLCWYAVLHVGRQLTPLQTYLTILITASTTVWYLFLHTAFGREVLASILGSFFYDGMRRAARFVPWLLLGLIGIGLLLSVWS